MADKDRTTYRGWLTVSIGLLFIFQSISNMKVMQFQGMGKKAVPISLPPVEHYDLTPSPDVPFAIMKRKLMATNDITEAKKIAAEMKAYLEVGKEKIIAHQARLISVLSNGRRKIPGSQQNYSSDW